LAIDRQDVPPRAKRKIGVGSFLAAKGVPGPSDGQYKQDHVEFLIDGRCQLHIDCPIGTLLLFWGNVPLEHVENRMAPVRPFPTAIPDEAPDSIRTEGANKEPRHGIAVF